MVTAWRPTLSPTLSPRAGRAWALGHSAVCLRAPCAGPIQIVWMLTNSRMPKTESSRPKPLDLTPPKGSRGSEAVMPLMKTAPDSRRRDQAARAI